MKILLKILLVCLLVHAWSLPALCNNSGISPKDVMKSMPKNEQERIDAKIRIKKEALDNLEEQKQKLIDYYTNKSQDDDVKHADLVIWDYIMTREKLISRTETQKLQALKAYDYDKVKQKTTLGEFNINSIIYSTILFMKSNDSFWPYFYIDALIQNQPYYDELVLKAKITQEFKDDLDNQQKAINLFVALKDITTDTENVLDTIHDCIADKKLRARLNDEIQNADSAHLSLDNIGTYQNIKHKLPIAFLLLKMTELKMAAYFGTPPRFEMNSREKLAYKLLRRERLKFQVLTGESVLPLSKSEEDYINSHRRSLERAAAVDELQNNIILNLSDPVREDLNRIFTAANLIEEELSGNVDDAKFLSTFYVSDNLTKLLHRRFVLQRWEQNDYRVGNIIKMLKSIDTSSEDSTVSLDEKSPGQNIKKFVYKAFLPNNDESKFDMGDYPQLENLDDLIFLGADIDPVDDNEKKYVDDRKKILEQAMDAYRNVKSVEEELTNTEKEYLAQKKVINKILDTQREGMSAAFLADEINSTGSKMYFGLKKDLFEKAKVTTSELIKSYDNISPYIQVNGFTFDDMADAFKNAQSPRTRPFAIRKLELMEVIDSTKAKELKFDTEYEDNAHTQFNCNRETCPYMVHYDEDRYKTYQIKYGAQVGLTMWLIDKADLEDFFFPFDDTAKEHHWYETHKINTSEQKVLKSINQEILDNMRDGYFSFKKLIYFDDSEKSERFSKTIFRDIDDNPFIKGDASDLAQVSNDDDLSDFVYKGWENFSSSFMEGFTKLNKIYSKMGNDEYSQANVAWIPSEKEVFSMYGSNPYFKYSAETSLSYPKVLDNFSHVEKQMLFENFLYLYMLEDDEKYVRVMDFMKNIQSVFSSMIEEEKINSSDLVKLTSVFLPFIPVNTFLEDDKFKALKLFWDKHLTEPERVAINEQTMNRMLRPLISESIMKKLKISKSELENALNSIVISKNPLFGESFFNKFELSFGESISNTFTNNYIPDSKEFKRWFFEQYGFDFNSKLYLDVHPEFLNYKNELMTVNYIKYLLEVKGKGYNLLDYIQARTHLRLLANMARIRILYLKSLDSQLLETLLISDMVPRDCLDTVGRWFHILVILPFIEYPFIWYPMFSAIGRYMTRPAFSWFLNRTVPRLIESGALKGLRNTIIRAEQGMLNAANRISGLAFEPGSTLREGITGGENLAMKNLVTRWAEQDFLSFYTSGKEFVERKNPILNRLYQSGFEVKQASSQAEYQGAKLALREKVELFFTKFKDLKFITRESKNPLVIAGKEKETHIVKTRFMDKHTYFKSKLPYTEAKTARKSIINYKLPKDMTKEELAAMGFESAEAYIEKLGINDIADLIARRGRTLSEIERQLFSDNIRLFSDELAFYLRTVKSGDRTLSIDLIPVGQSGLAEIFGSTLPNAVLENPNMFFTYLDLRNKGQYEAVIRVLDRYLRSQGRNPANYTFADVLNEFLHVRAGTGIDAVITQEGESIIVKAVSDKFLDQVARSNTRFLTKAIGTDIKSTFSEKSIFTSY